MPPSFGQSLSPESSSSMFSIPPLDFAGQHKAEKIMHTSIVGSSVVGLALGFSLGSLRLVYTCFFIGVLIASVATIPPWGYLRMNPIKFVSESVFDDDAPEEAEKKTQ
ncbi:hypothetical protein H9P43_000312 [Blastocladiella emersonii ATCC 22665]|nr:hypothetical protein H9P43_000312 [Blastocladiella emersonii ATCC 22665]